MNGAADPTSTESISCKEEKSEVNNSSLETLVEIEIDDNAAPKVARPSSSHSQVRRSTRIRTRHE
jgi:hypothetical protein